MTPAPVWGRSLDLAYSAPPTYLTPVARLPWDTPDTTVAPGLSSAAFLARGPRADPVLEQRKAAVGAVTRGLYSEKLSRELRGIATQENIAALGAMLTKYPALAVVQIPTEDTMFEMARSRYLPHGLAQVTRLASRVLFYGTSEPSQAQDQAFSKAVRRLTASAPLRELLARAQEVSSVHAVPLTQLLREEAVRLLKRHAPSVERLGLNANEAGMLLAMTTEDPRLQTLGDLIQMAPRLALRKELVTLMTGGLDSKTINQLGWVLGMGNEGRVLAIEQGLTSLNDSAKIKPLTDLPTLLSITRPFVMAKKRRGAPTVDGFHDLGGRSRRVSLRRRHHRSLRRARRSRSRHARQFF